MRRATAVSSRRLVAAEHVEDVFAGEQLHDQVEERALGAVIEETRTTLGWVSLAAMTASRRKALGRSRGRA